MSTPSSLDRYRKQMLFAPLGEAGQQRLQDSCALIVGCGALGSVIAETLARAGVGHLRIVDRDFVDLSNLQRQVLFDEEDVAQRLPKALAAATKLSRINSAIQIEPHVADVRSSNVLELLAGVNVILDGTDNFETRFLINDAAWETKTPWVHAGCVGSHGQVAALIPGKSPCFRCLMPDVPDAGGAETCDTAGVLGSAVNIVASLQAMLAIKILTGHSDSIPPELIVLDVWEPSLRRLNLAGLAASDDCACCGKGDRTWLQGEQGSRTTVLCGRNSVQVTPAASQDRLNLKQLAERLSRSGDVRSNPFLVIFRPADSSCELNFFADGRAIISGTEDLSVARSLYARYLGS